MKKDVNYNLPYKPSSIAVFGIGSPAFPKCLGHLADSVYIQVSTTMSTVRDWDPHKEPERHGHM